MSRKNVVACLGCLSVLLLLLTFSSSLSSSPSRLPPTSSPHPWTLYKNLATPTTTTTSSIPTTPTPSTPSPTPPPLHSTVGKMTVLIDPSLHPPPFTPATQSLIDKATPPSPDDPISITIESKEMVFERDGNTAFDGDRVVEVGDCLKVSIESLNARTHSFCDYSFTFDGSKFVEDFLAAHGEFWGSPFLQPQTVGMGVPSEDVERERVAFETRLREVGGVESLAEERRASVGDLGEALGRRRLLLMGDSISNYFFKGLKCLSHSQGASVLIETDQMRGDRKRAEENKWSSPTEGEALARGGIMMRRDAPRYEERVFEDTLGVTDVLVFNFGLHYSIKPKELAAYGAEMEAAFARVIQWVDEAPDVRVAVWVETSAQHFDAQDGLYQDAKSVQKESCSCLPHARPNVTDPRNTLVASLLDKLDPSHSRISTLPLHRLTRGLWDRHVASLLNPGTGAIVCDCTHLCFLPHLIDQFIAHLTLILRAAVKT